MRARLKNKFRGVVVAVFSRPIFSWKIRVCAYRFFGAQVASNSVVGYGCIFAGPLSNFIVGDSVYINHNVFFGAEAKIRVCDFARIGPYVRILTRMHPIESSIVRRAPDRDFDLEKRIGLGAWIGIGAIILPGVDVADGCVIGAGSVVVKSTLPNGLYAGNPARRIKDLPI